jgi:hypothetical protein
MHALRVKLAATAALAIATIGGLTATGSPANATMRRSAPAADLGERPGTLVPAISVQFAGLALRNGYTGKCLDDSVQYGLRTYGCNHNSYINGYQAWRTVPGHPGQLQNLNTGLCVETVPSSVCATTAATIPATTVDTSIGSR